MIDIYSKIVDAKKGHETVSEKARVSYLIRQVKPTSVRSIHGGLRLWTRRAGTQISPTMPGARSELDFYFVILRSISDEESI